MSEWTVVLNGGWYLPHLVNMLREYQGNCEQNECRDEMIAQIERQMITGNSVVRTTRPLVVIDPEDAEQVERLLFLLPEGSFEDVQIALREFARPTPPKPEEPTGLGAVVEDVEGARWVRRFVGDSSHWCPADSTGWHRWDDIAAVRVLSEGVS